MENEYPDRLTVIDSLNRETNDSLFGEKILKGRVSNELIKKSITNPENTAVFACGPDHSSLQKRKAKEKGETLPPSFMSSVLSYLSDIIVPKNKIKKESYG